MKNAEALSNTPGVAPLEVKDERYWKTAPEAEKLENGWRFVTIPDKDPYDYVFAGIYLNNEHFKPGVHLLPKDKADSIEERLVAFAKYNTRLMRPSADLTSLSQVPGAR